jgi:20S proteasome alpha/beta subunit
MISAPKPRPIFRPKSKRLPKAYTMTIAAGFPCSDGLVLCADTQEIIYSYAKVNTQKMTQIKSPHFNVAFTGAGDTGLLETTIQAMVKALILSDPKPHSIVEVEETLRGVLVETFDRHVAPYYQFPLDERPTADLLIGVQYDGMTSLFRAYGTSFFQTYEPQCVGAGVVLGKSLIAQLFDNSMSIARGWLVALYVLNQAKTWVDGCGGNTDILLLSNRDKKVTRIPTTEVEELESHFKQFNAFIQPLFVAVADRGVPHESFEQLVKQFRVDMLGLRGKFMEYEEFTRRLCELQGIQYPFPDTTPELFPPNPSQSSKP